MDRSSELGKRYWTSKPARLSLEVAPPAASGVGRKSGRSKLRPSHFERLFGALEAFMLLVEAALPAGEIADPTTSRRWSATAASSLWRTGEREDEQPPAPAATRSAAARADGCPQARHVAPSRPVEVLDPVVAGGRGPSEMWCEPLAKVSAWRVTVIGADLSSSSRSTTTWTPRGSSTRVSRCGRGTGCGTQTGFRRAD